jgi:hypothetical protein
MRDSMCSLNAVLDTMEDSISYLISNPITLEGRLANLFITNLHLLSLRRADFLEWRLRAVRARRDNLSSFFVANIPIAYCQNKGFQYVPDSILLSSMVMVEI